MRAFHYRNQRLHCEEADLEAVAAKFGTPLYVYSAGTIRDHYRRLDRAFDQLDHLICYAAKANTNRAVLSLLSREGAGFDIVSGGELARVIAAGGAPDKCTFAGVAKSIEEMEFALDRGIFSFNVESEAELSQIDQIAGCRGMKAPVALRVNPDVAAGTHKYVSTGTSENKFGIGLDRIRHVYEAASRLPNIHLRGLQMHIGSQITQAQPFVDAIAKLSPLVLELKARYGIEFFSVGGGMGIVYESSFSSGRGGWWKEEGQPERKLPTLTIDEYASAIVPSLRTFGLRILLEPGRVLVGNAGVLLTRVRYLKQAGQRQFVIVDAGMNDLIRPALYQSYHEIVPVREPSASTGEKGRYDVVGPVCESGDFFAENRELPEIREGDLVALMSAGAYGFVMASNYNSRPLPAEVLVRSQDAALVRERQPVGDLMRGERDTDF
ncbi:MAG: diaminopimelate decarboxylase [Chthoniobacterales bacterium]